MLHRNAATQSVSLHSIAPSLSHSLSSAKAAIITLYEQREIVFLFVQSCSKSLKLRRLSLLYIGHIVSGLINKNYYKITKKWKYGKLRRKWGKVQQQQHSLRFIVSIFNSQPFYCCFWLIVVVGVHSFAMNLCNFSDHFLKSFCSCFSSVIYFLRQFFVVVFVFYEIEKVFVLQSAMAMTMTGKCKERQSA